MASNHELNLTVPFESEHQASVAKKSIDPDPDLKPDQFNRKIVQEGNTLKVQFNATSDRTLRVGVNSFMDNLNLVVECLDELDPVSNAL